MAGGSTSRGLSERCIETEKTDRKSGMGEDELIASLIVGTIAKGRKVAAGIDQYLQAGKSAKRLAN
jgi:hypothetical protein